ncbi:MAG TPA: response regulator [Actinomycetota bacterium]|jgi:DNA-binding response OmpR family regulator|nr:response regulator [Actinomycetota bacterium]
MKKLLIADDEEGVRALVRMTLDTGRYMILEAADGDEALEIGRTEQPQLVLLDIEMPGRSGLEVCRTLKSEDATSGATILMLTARAQQADIEAGRSAGADGYFTKPFSPFDLMSKVDEVLGAEDMG